MLLECEAKIYLQSDATCRRERAVIQGESAVIISDGIVHEGPGFPERLELFGERHDPTLPNRFFDAGPGRWHALLMQLLKSPDAKRKLSIPDANQVAADLAGLRLGLIGLEVKLGAAAVSLTQAEVTQLVQHGMAVFRSHYGQSR